jgi:hypothetical protein
MPKVKGPLLSGDAQGQFGRKMIFKRGGIVVNYFKPRNPNSPAQQAVREAFRSLYMAGITQEQADLLYAALDHNHDDRYFPAEDRHYRYSWVVECAINVNTPEYPMDQWASIASGGIAPIEDEANHPGIYRFTSHSANANSGRYGRFQSIAVMIFQGGESLEIIFRVPSANNVLHRLGWHDLQAVAGQPVDGAWLEIAGATVTGKAANNSSATTTPTSYTIAENTWYRAHLAVREDLSAVDYSLFASPGVTPLWESSVAANIPTGAGRNFGGLLVVGKTTGGTANIFDIDWLKFSCNKVLDR